LPRARGAALRLEPYDVTRAAFSNAESLRAPLNFNPFDRVVDFLKGSAGSHMSRPRESWRGRSSENRSDGRRGLRGGEMIALEWRDVDLGNRQICVQRSDWNSHVTTPKGGRLRYVPLTIRLAAAFRDHRHLRSPTVLCQDDGQPLTRQMVEYRVLRASRRAKLSRDGVHILRRTFCSHLAMRGAPPESDSGAR
jgi:hypothetical protein